ncbi:tyrosine-type recombinase/integrase [Methanococcoides sp.]|uniref:tyrosine-type recombinase/integrase n=1 Tax=Methanococcoides sp. TaxID=1966350 RepID=UPI00272E8AB2|nr:tyrosine-type recombinase/integrase [Methanococcoides sp.]
MAESQKNEPDAPLWVTLDNNIQAMSYKSIRVNFKNISKRASIKKPVNPHSFRHLAVTNWILDGLNEQEIKHRCWLVPRISTDVTYLC